MPHVTVLFNPKLVEQRIVDQLKKMLQQVTADALINSLVLNPDACTGFNIKNIKVTPDQIYVGQRATHETDINPAPIEILIEAGRPNGRNPYAVLVLIEKKIEEGNWIPSHLRGEGQSCVWVKFCESNSFRFIREQAADASGVGPMAAK